MDAPHQPSRRRFLTTSGLAAGGLVVAFVVPHAHRFAAAQTDEAVPAAGPFVPNAYLRIGTDETITVLLAHSEMGQGIWTTLPMLVAEELEADWSTIRVEHAPAAPAYAHTAFGMQMTGGSSSTWSEFERYRTAGATAKALLAEAAAQRFGVPAAQVKLENGTATAGAQRATYGELADAASRLPAPTGVKLKDPKSFRLIGQATKRLDAPEKVTGRATFGIDVQFEGLLTALVARSPTFGDTVKSFDAAAARAIPGVRDIVQVPSGVAVVADHFWAAKRGRDALVVEWTPTGAAGTADSATLRNEFRTLLASEGAFAAEAGTTIDTLGTAAKVIEAEYIVPYLAHAPMEPLNCTVRIEADSCEIWTGTQFQTMDQAVAAQITGLEPGQVTIHTTFLGGGFGRRATPTSDFVAEAVHVAKAAGKPVKTVWTREDDIRGGYYRPLYVQQARIAVGSSGMPTAWHHKLAGQSIAEGTPFAAVMVKDGVDSTSVEGVANSPYLEHLKHKRVELHSTKTGIPVLWWRSVGHSYNAFVMESLIDELAKNAGKDPVAYRRALLSRHPRHLGVLNLAAEKAGWDTPAPAGRARGVAVHESFGSYLAQVAEVSREGPTIRVHRVVCAIDCGIAVNPAGIVAQVESGIAFGLGAALHGAIELKDGRVQQSNFHDYRVLRLDEMPEVEVHIVPSSEKPGGVGEPGVPPIAPAVANAIATLTGQRLRELPLRLGA